MSVSQIGLWVEPLASEVIIQKKKKPYWEKNFVFLHSFFMFC